MTSRTAIGLFLVLASLANESCPADAPFKSGLQPGDKLPGAFHPLNVSGVHAGERYCLVCENGLNPVVMIFAREPSEVLARLLAKIDTAAAKHKDRELGSFAVFLSESKDLEQQLQQLARKHNLKHLVLSIDDPAGPEDYKVAVDADVTVVLYSKHQVKTNHALRKGDLTDSAIEKVLADLPKILTEK